MTATEKATAKIASLTAEQLFGAWEYTQYSRIEPETSITRGWLMDEIEKRYPEGFDAWLDQEAPEDSDLRRFCLVNPMCLSCSRFAAESTGDWCDENGKCRGEFNRSYSNCIMRR